MARSCTIAVIEHCVLVQVIAIALNELAIAVIEHCVQVIAIAVIDHNALVQATKSLQSLSLNIMHWYMSLQLLSLNIVPWYRQQCHGNRCH